MPRRAKIDKRVIHPDAKFNSVLVSTLVNKIMQDGKKSTAERVLYDAINLIEQQEHKAGVTVLEQAIKNATPLLEVKPRRVGGATSQVPVEVATGRGLALAIRWLLKSARARGGKSMAEKLSIEFVEAAKGTGPTIKRREDTHKMAEANRAFAHYRW